jgi:hypothetical protein
MSKPRILRLGAGTLLVAAGAFFPPPIAHFALLARDTPAALDTAIARMGGRETLERIERVRFETVTLWQRMTFENRPSDLIIALRAAQRPAELLARRLAQHAALRQRAGAAGDDRHCSEGRRHQALSSTG